MKKKKIFMKLTMLAITVVMTGSLFTGCGSNTSSSGTGTSNGKAVTISMLYADNAAYPFNKNWVSIKKAEKLANVKFDIQSVPDGDYGTKRQLILNSGNMPDIIFKTGESDISDYALNGKILPISDYINKMPNFKKFVKKYGYEKELDNMRESNGKFYCLPVNANTKKVPSEVFMVRKDILEKNGLKVPTTLEELYQDAKILKAKYPDSDPITNEFGEANLLSMFAPAFGTTAGWGAGPGGFQYDKAADKWINAPTSDNYKQMLMYFNKLYKEGILDKEFATLNSNVYTQKKTTGKSFFFVDWLSTTVSTNNDGKKLDPNFDIESVMAYKGASGKSLLPATGMYSQSMTLPASVKDSPNFNAILKFVDWLYSDEAADLFTWGVKGVTYNEVNGEKKYNDKVKTLDDASKKYGLSNNCFTVVRPYDWVIKNMSAQDAKLVDQVSKEDGIAETQPSLRLTSDEKSEEQLIRQTLKDYTDQMTLKFIYGKESFDNWDNYIKEADTKGRTKLADIYNKAWKRQESKK